MNAEALSRAFFIATLLFGLFIVGGIFGSKEWHPYQFFEDSFFVAARYFKTDGADRPRLLREIRYPGKGVVLHHSNRTFDGLTAVQGVFPEGNEIRLLNMEGEVVHSWRADFFEIWPKPSHIMPREQIPAGKFNFHTQGLWVLQDGSIVFNFAEKGTVKLDRCGKLVWKVDRMTHHSVTPVINGNFWIPVKGNTFAVAENLLLPAVDRDTLAESAGWYEDRAILVGGNGEIVKEVPLLDGFFSHEFERVLYDLNKISPADPTHVNDIEVVTTELAKKLEGVEVGDLLLSVRQAHMIAIVDGESGEVKWHATGPWIRQHDLDITEQGTIEIFNNGTEDLAIDRIPGSSIIEFDPADNSSQVRYPLTGEDRFYSDIMGTHQKLPNGNRLITETMAGRVIEVDADGETVWELLLPFDDTHSSVIESAIRYKNDYFSVEKWGCNKKQ